MFSLENIRRSFSLYVCLSKFRENTRQYKCLSEYYTRKTYSSENCISSVSLASAIGSYCHSLGSCTFLMTSHRNFSSLIITWDENFKEQRKPSEIMGHDNSDHINSENSRETLRFSEKIEKSRASLGKKFRNF